MSIVNISDISVLSNPARFHDPYVFKVTFECLAPLKDGACLSRQEGDLRI
jgi:histone chaperone ASF1